MANSYRLDPDLLAAAAELWCDHLRNDAATVAALVESGTCGRSKAYELVRQVRSDALATSTAAAPRFNVASYVISQWVQLVESSAVPEDRRAALTGLTSATARLKIREVPATGILAELQSDASDNLPP